MYRVSCVQPEIKIVYAIRLQCPYSLYYFVLSVIFQESADCLVSGDSGVRVRSISYEYNDCMNF